MLINKIIIHEIIKNPKETKTVVNFSTEVIPIDKQSLNFVTVLDSSFRSDRIFHAVFDESPGKYFPEKFKDYENSTKDNESFIRLTTSLIGNLDSQLSQISMAKGGYFVFAEYIINKISFFSVFLIRDVEGKSLQKTKNSFKITDVDYVETNNLAMACRLNKNRKSSRVGNYLTLTQLKQNEVSEYFKKWISIIQVESSKEYTESLYQIITQLEVPIDSETNEKYSLTELRAKVHSFVSSRPDKRVNINELSSHFYGSGNVIERFAEENDIIIDAEFRYNPKVLRKFIKLEVLKDGIELKMSRGDYNKKVKLSKENPNIIVIESKLFAQALREEMDGE